MDQRLACLEVHLLRPFGEGHEVLRGELAEEIRALEEEDAFDVRQGHGASHAVAGAFPQPRVIPGGQSLESAIDGFPLDPQVPLGNSQHLFRGCLQRGNQEVPGFTGQKGVEKLDGYRPISSLFRVQGPAKAGSPRVGVEQAQQSADAVQRAAEAVSQRIPQQGTTSIDADVSLPDEQGVVSRISAETAC